jgi:hypothetical protein
LKTKEVKNMNLKQEIAQARKQAENNDPVIRDLRETILEGARQGKDYITYGDENMPDSEQLTIQNYLTREKMKYGVKRERRTVVEEIHYNPDAPDFLDQLRWHGYKTECETEKDVFMYFYVYLD